METINEAVVTATSWDEEVASCQECFITYPETEINMVDYDIDICVKCEYEKLNRNRTKDNLLRRAELVLTRLYSKTESFKFDLISYNTLDYSLFFIGTTFEINNLTSFIFRVDSNDQVCIKSPASKKYIHYISLVEKGVR
jgi:hypothetical protein